MQKQAPLNPYSPPDEDAPAHRVVMPALGKRVRRPIQSFTIMFLVTGFLAGPWLHLAPIESFVCILVLSLLAARFEFKVD